MAGFPDTAERLASHGLDGERSLRALLEEITGWDGDKLSEEIDRGTELGKVEHLVNPVGKPRMRLDMDTTLTPSELEVLELLADGHTVRQVAAIRCSSAETVKTQVNGLRGKLGARNIAHAVLLGIRTGQLDA